MKTLSVNRKNDKNIKNLRKQNRKGAKKNCGLNESYVIIPGLQLYEQDTVKVSVMSVGHDSSCEIDYDPTLQVTARESVYCKLTVWWNLKPAFVLLSLSAQSFRQLLLRRMLST